VTAGTLLVALAFALLGSSSTPTSATRSRRAGSSSPSLPPVEAERRAGGSELPTVSVLVAARNEAPVIGARIRNLLEQDYPAGRLEILVASDASDDGTDEIVRTAGDPRSACGGRSRAPERPPRSTSSARWRRVRSWSRPTPT